LNSGFNPVPKPWVVVGSTLTCIFLEYKLELALFCQLYLIAATLPRTIDALAAVDERKGCPLELKLPFKLRGCLKPGNGCGSAICPVLIELGVSVLLLSYASCIHTPDTGCRL
jgi:hypothetical protein